MNILDKFKSILFCFHTFGVRSTIDVLDSENQPGSGSGKIQTGSGALRLKGDTWHQKYSIKKEGFKNYLNYSFNRLLKISLCLRVQIPDPVFDPDPRSSFRPKPDPHPCIWQTSYTNLECELSFYVISMVLPPPSFATDGQIYDRSIKVLQFVC